MTQVEDRLRRAAAETREVAQRKRPVTRPTTRRASGNGGVFALAVGFTVVLVIFGALPLLLEPDREPPTETTPLAAPSSTVASSTPVVSCSAEGFEGPVSQLELPEEAAATRAAIVDSAVACDFDGLEARAADEFVASFGGGGAEILRTLEAEGGELDTLLELLQMSYGTIDVEGGGVIYVWPSAFTYETWDQVPAQAVEELRSIHTDEEIDSFEMLGAYLGWRTAIDSKGRWLYFVAGD